MRFEPIRYLDWARRRFDEEPPAYNLAVSGLEPASLTDAGIDPAALLIAGRNAFGHPGVRRRLAEQYGVSSAQVMVASGTSGANFLLQAALLREGDSVLCEWPCYEPLWRSLESLGARITWVRRDSSNQFVPDLAAISDGFARGARLCMLTDLHNPSATLMSREVVREIGRLARRHDAWVIVDEVYLSSVFGAPVASAATLGERLVITASLTKTHGLGGLRAGWVIAPKAVVERANDVNAYLIGNAPFIADEAACQALDHLPRLLARARQRREENWPVVRAFAAKRHLLECEPAGAFIVWLKLPDGLEADRFVDHLYTKYGTLVVPGTFFGVGDHVRLGFGLGSAVVNEGLQRVGQALDDLVVPQQLA